MPSLTGVLETSLYADDLDRASRFYEETLGLTRIEGDERFRAYSVGGRSVLLLFKRGASNRVTELAAGKLGPRGGSSIYFRDPDNHSVELATPGLWSIY